VPSSVLTPTPMIKKTQLGSDGIPPSVVSQNASGNGAGTPGLPIPPTTSGNGSSSLNSNGVTDNNPYVAFGSRLQAQSAAYGRGRSLSLGMNMKCVISSIPPRSQSPCLNKSILTPIYPKLTPAHTPTISPLRLRPYSERKSSISPSPVARSISPFHLRGIPNMQRKGGAGAQEAQEPGRSCSPATRITRAWSTSSLGSVPCLKSYTPLHKPLAWKIPLVKVPDSKGGASSANGTSSTNEDPNEDTGTKSATPSSNPFDSLTHQESALQTDVDEVNPEILERQENLTQQHDLDFQFSVTRAYVKAQIEPSTLKELRPAAPATRATNIDLVSEKLPAPTYIAGTLSAEIEREKQERAPEPHQKSEEPRLQSPKYNDTKPSLTRSEKNVTIIPKVYFHATAVTDEPQPGGRDSHATAVAAAAHATFTSNAAHATFTSNAAHATLPSNAAHANLPSNAAHAAPITVGNNDDELDATVRVKEDDNDGEAQMGYTSSRADKEEDCSHLTTSQSDLTFVGPSLEGSEGNGHDDEVKIIEEIPKMMMRERENERTNFSRPRCMKECAQSSSVHNNVSGECSQRLLCPSGEYNNNNNNNNNYNHALSPCEKDNDDASTDESSNTTRCAEREEKQEDGSRTSSKMMSPSLTYGGSSTTLGVELNLRDPATLEKTFREADLLQSLRRAEIEHILRTNNLEDTFNIEKDQSFQAAAGQKGAPMDSTGSMMWEPLEPALEPIIEKDNEGESPKRSSSSWEMPEIIEDMPAEVSALKDARQELLKIQDLLTMHNSKLRDANETLLATVAAQKQKIEFLEAEGRRMFEEMSRLRTSPASPSPSYSGRDSSIVLPFNRKCLGVNLSISQDGYRLCRVEGCRQSIAMGMGSLQCLPQGGYFYQVSVDETMGGWVGALGLGVTRCPEAIVDRLPEKAWKLPHTYMIGYWGRLFCGNKEYETTWEAQRLKPGDVIGFRITKLGEIIVYVNGVAQEYINACFPTDDKPCYPLVDVFGATTSVTMLKSPGQPPGDDVVLPARKELSDIGLSPQAF